MYVFLMSLDWSKSLLSTCLIYISGILCSSVHVIPSKNLFFILTKDKFFLFFNHFFNSLNSQWIKSSPATHFYTLKIPFHQAVCHITGVKCNNVIVNSLRSCVSLRSCASLNVKKRHCELYNNHSLFWLTTPNKQQNKTRINVYLFHAHTHTHTHTHTLPLTPYPFLCIISLHSKLPPASVLPSLNWFFRNSKPFTPLSLCCASAQCSLHMTNHLPCLYVISYHFRPCPLFCISLSPLLSSPSLGSWLYRSCET